ncbi:MAG: hypothetical protein IPM52_08855 [Bacteroidetes bacterium]|nr:hypothetical protein [Bacteroidota bacterium]
MDHRANHWGRWWFVEPERVTMHFGIDYGARFAGTTAVCFDLGSSLLILQAAKKQDADAFCRDQISARKPSFVMIDAPLSLPRVYTKPRDAVFSPEDDYFFREADRQLGAMSPMFLGGLTARAMQLSAFFAAQGIPFFETWPSRLRSYFGSENRPECDVLAAQLKKLTGFELVADKAISPHGIDSALAWFAGWLKMHGRSNVYGSEAEGVVWC